MGRYGGFAGAFALALGAVVFVLGPVLVVPRAEAQVPADSVLGVSGFNPRYLTTYKVLKTRQSWDQSFSLDQRLGDVRVNGRLSSAISGDEAQNDLRNRTSMFNNQLDYEVATGLAFGLFTNLNRARQQSLTSDLKTSNDVFRLTGNLVRDLFDKKVRSTLRGEGGIAQVGSESERDLGATGTLDETTQTGPSVSVAWQVVADPTPALNLTFDVSRDAFQQETEEKHADLDRDLNVISRSDTTLEANNVSQKLASSMDWRPSKMLSAALGFSRESGRELRPAPRQGELEETEKDITGLTARARLDLRENLQLSADYGRTDDARSSNLTTATNKDAISERVSLGGSYTVWGTKLESSFDESDGDEDYKPIPGLQLQPDIRTKVRHLRSSVSRSLGKRVGAAVTSDFALNQRFYEDGVLDSDRFDRATDFTMTYTPFAALSSRVSFSEARKRTVQVHPSQALNTRDEQRITVEGFYSYKVTPGVTAEQRLVVSAESRVFDFADEDDSDLRRDTRVTTVADVALTAHVKVRLQHDYNFRNSGQYRLNERRVRVFRLQSEFIEQKLRVGFDYTPSTWLQFRGTQELRAIENRSPRSTGTRTTQYDLDLSGSLKRMLMGSVDTSLDVKRVLSTQQEHYWQVEMSANRSF
jgi:hypothetical protein